MIRHVAGFAEIVEDVPAALRFYRDVLGLEVKFQDGEDYAILLVPGVLHFGIWNRAHAALSVLGSRDAADKIALGYTLEFEVDSVQEAAEHLAAAGEKIVNEPREEPWGQKCCRVMSPSGSLLGFAESPWARTLKQQLEAAEGEAGV